MKNWATALDDFQSKGEKMMETVGAETEKAVKDRMLMSRGWVLVAAFARSPDMVGYMDGSVVL
ncbi:MAG: hypothetical protein Q9177_006164 [Variospora cf. flavescens]